MNIKYIASISFICCIAGFLFFAIQKEFILFRYNTTILTQDTLLTLQNTAKKNIVFYFWHESCWKHETKQCLWTSKKGIDLKQIILTWLTTLHEEQIIPAPITIQAVTLNPTGYEAFLSFEQNPLPKNGPIINKIRWLEGLLKTIRENKIGIQSIYFLQNHQPLSDAHLDFSQPWPIQGFLE